ncbi:VOC family protein [Janibacter anophelis]|uniref:VOC family protein n=1 Tax=Janibacter anophelis TaxID=319054 RepID=UPI000DEEC3E0|nr:VOC family protein [Janibacter anophelis]
MTLTLGMITTDTSDAAALGTWWAEQTGGTVVETNDGWFVTVQLPGGPMLAFQRVDDPTPGKNRLHLDLGAPDLDAEVQRLTAVGAQVVAERSMGDFRWVTLTDPDGNEFCVANH